MGARSEHEALGVFMHADFLRHGPLPSYARGRGAVGGAEPWPQVHPGVVLYEYARVG